MSKEQNEAGSVRRTHTLHLRDREVAAEYLLLHWMMVIPP